MKQKRLVTVLAVILSLALILVFLARCTEDYRRNAREQKYLLLAMESAKEFAVPPAMVLAVIRTESDFRPGATSSAGACGLMQLMPDTFIYLQDSQFHETLPKQAIFTPAVNVRYGTYYLSYLFDKFGNWQTALAAYNAGEGRVTDWLRDPALSDGIRLYAIPFPETARYVKRTLSAYADYRAKYQNLS